ncbi:ATP-binding protein [Streptomyces sp. DSM 41972]|uniref:ATP-binding protein n=1 Tax=Streptomyces althioticus subsp. attaecolombicae TaxID=3075534 RepID=A0ABU3HWA8_9ACTN|nr:ATP-binding protein [Streptomyces sp. DSM 41972]SCD96386.1 Anti-sigma regulatory factor (Ser/Thr protein kinase) [Streptomyces sp. di50b]SCE22390.1 Anti-sigma regulatory factor (Ser/Thr protein kinase) [Streptomyces sp. di188]
MNRTEQPAPATPVHSCFTLRFSPTPRGARLARRLCGDQLDAWGIPYDSNAHDVLSLLISELATNAVTHGHVTGRDFRVHLLALSTPDAAALTIRVEVTDTRGDRLPEPPATPAAPGAQPAADSARTGGRGLFLVEALADRWGWAPREDGPGKTVWAEYTAVTTATVTTPAPVARSGPSAARS